MEKPELLQLIFLAKEKNQKAQTKLINLFWTDVFSFVMKKVHDENAADELTVSVFSMEILARAKRASIVFKVENVKDSPSLKGWQNFRRKF